ncbi:MAG: cation:proton antiporter [Pseudomonadales bacterium]
MYWIWISIAFLCGFLARQIGLPPLVGYLFAGFGLQLAGVKPDPSLDTLGDIGISLLLFTIGLKLRLGNLRKAEVFGAASAHMLTIVLLTTANCFFLGALGMFYFADISLAAAVLVGFAVSFSSTVIAVKVLEENGEMRTRHGQVAIGILIVQDIAAVAFVTLVSDTHFGWQLAGLLLLPLFVPLLGSLLSRSGHGELLPLSGICIALIGGVFFEWMGLKAHLGALVFGLLLSRHAQAVELSRSLLHFKDLFLIGFFLSVGFVALPNLQMLAVALVMALALPFKAILFYFWLLLFRMRARSAFLAALALANYSEFGLIVAALSVKQGLLDEDWLVIIALSVALSFIFSSALNAWSNNLYEYWQGFLKRFERSNALLEDAVAYPGDVEVLVVGMGRVGGGAYDTLREEWGNTVYGMDVESSRAAEQAERGRRVICGDAEDPDFWPRLNLHRLRVVMFSLPNYKDTLQAVAQLKRAGFTGKTASISRYEDEKEKLLEGGVDEVHNFYAEAGAGFAEQCRDLLGKPVAARASGN